MRFLWLVVFVDTPTGDQCGPPSTIYSARRTPLRGRLRFDSLRSSSRRRPRKGDTEWKENNLQKRFYTPLNAALIIAGALRCSKILVVKEGAFA